MLRLESFLLRLLFWAVLFYPSRKLTLFINIKKPDYSRLKIRQTALGMVTKECECHFTYFQQDEMIPLPIVAPKVFEVVIFFM